MSKTRRKFVMPEPHQEDYELPYFLGNDERYIDLMVAVRKVLDEFPRILISKESMSELNESYHLLISNASHPFEPLVTERYNIPNLRENAPAINFIENKCLWCDETHE